MKLTMEHLENHGIEIDWFDAEGNNRRIAKHRAQANERNSRMFILGSVIVEFSSRATITFIPLAAVEFGWVSS